MWREEKGRSRVCPGAHTPPTGRRMCEAMGRQCNDKPRHARVRIGASRQPRVSALLRHSLHGRRSACNHSLAVCTAQGLGCGCRGVGRATVSSLHGNPGQRPTARLHAGMVSHVQREQGGNAGNDGGEANAGTGAADRGASPSFAEVEAFFAERQVSNVTAHCRPASPNGPRARAGTHALRVLLRGRRSTWPRRARPTASASPRSAPSRETGSGRPPPQTVRGAQLGDATAELGRARPGAARGPDWGA